MRTGTVTLTFMKLLFFLALLMSMATLAPSSVEPHDEPYLAEEKVPVSLRFHLRHQLLAGSSKDGPCLPVPMHLLNGAVTHPPSVLHPSQKCAEPAVKSGFSEIEDKRNLTN